MPVEIAINLNKTCTNHPFNPLNYPLKAVSGPALEYFMVLDAPVELRKNWLMIEAGIGSLKFDPAEVSAMARAYCDSLKKTAPRNGQIY